MAIAQRDIEEDEEALDRYDGDTIDFWSKKQRELVTNSVDYNLGVLQSLITDSVIDLAPKFQRRARWNEVKQSRLIESFLMNVPVPPIFLNEDDVGTYSVIDGKQRLTAIYKFLTNGLRLTGLEVFSDINGLTFFELPPKLQSIIRTRPNIRAVTILQQSDPDIKHEVFQRLNTGGASLNPQEIRNNASSGPLNDLVMKLADSPMFHAALHIKNKDRSALYREMRDAEFVVRYFTFSGRWKDFSGGMRREMDRYMDVNRRMDADKLREHERRFIAALENVIAVADTNSSQRWMPEAGTWRKQVLAALFDAQMFVFESFSRTDLLRSKYIIIERYKGLFENDQFRKSIDAATNSPTYFKQRIEAVAGIVQASI